MEERHMDSWSGSYHVPSNRTTDVCANTGHPSVCPLGSFSGCANKGSNVPGAGYALGLPKTWPRLLSCFQSQTRSALGTCPHHNQPAVPPWPRISPQSADGSHYPGCPRSRGRSVAAFWTWPRLLSPLFLLGTDPHVSGKAAFKDSPDFPLVLLGLVSSA